MSIPFNVKQEKKSIINHRRNVHPNTMRYIDPYTNASFPMYPSYHGHTARHPINLTQRTEDSWLKKELRQNIPKQLNDIHKQMKCNEIAQKEKTRDLKTIKKVLDLITVYWKKNEKTINENIATKVKEMEEQLFAMDDVIDTALNNNESIQHIKEKCSEILDHFDDETNDKLNNLNVNINNLLAQTKTDKQTNSKQLCTMQDQLSKFIAKQTAINDEVHQYLEQKRNEKNTTKRLENDEKEIFRLWLQNTVKLPQYHDNFVENGFDNLQNVCHVNMFILEMIGIQKIGHKIEILKHCEKHKRMHLDSVHIDGVTNYYNDPKNIEIEKLSKIYKDKQCKLKRQYQDTIREIIKLNYTAKEDIDRYWKKGQVLKEFVRSKFAERKKLQKLKGTIIIQTNSSDTEYGPEHGPFIYDYLNINEENSLNPTLLNYVSTSSEPQRIKQSKAIKKVCIKNHQRIPQLNGEYGVVAMINIGKNTVIGEYAAKCLLQRDLHRINSEQMINEIDSYGFDAIIETQMTAAQWQCFDGTNPEMVFMQDVGQPPKKRRKLNAPCNKSGDNKISRTIDVILDGFSYEPRSILTFVNDCRRTFASREPTEQDKKYYNVKLITVDVNGWPRVFGIALRDIEPNEELACFYGEGFIEVQNKKTKLKQRKEEILKILSKHQMTLDI